MKIKKIMLVGIILLAILMVGAVSAVDDNFNDTLSADGIQETGEVSLNDNDYLNEMDPEDVDIEVDDIDSSDSSANFTTISVTERQGNFVIWADHDGDSQEIYREDLSESGRVYEEDDVFCLGVSLDDVNAYISRSGDYEDIYEAVSSGDVMRFVLEYTDCDFATEEYVVDFDGDDIIFSEKEIDENDFNFFMQTHASHVNGETRICQVWPDGVSQGTLFFTVSRGDNSRTYSKSIEDDIEDGEVFWILDELDFIDEPGIYGFNLTYEDLELECSSFTFTQLDYNICEGGIYIDYPFDVIKIWGEGVRAEVFVNSKGPFECGAEDPIRWTMDDLNITAIGDYDITIISYDESNRFIEEFRFTLNVFDEIEDLGFMVPLAVDSWIGDGNVFYLLCPDDCLGDELRLTVDDEFDIQFEVTGNVMGWTLDELNITTNDGHNIKLYDEDEYLFDAWIEVCCFENKIDCWIWDSQEDGTLYTDCEDNVVSVEIPEGKDGYIKINVNYEEIVSWEIDENCMGWSLEDLGITDAGEYAIDVRHVDYDESEEVLGEATLNVTEFDYASFRIVLDRGLEILRLFCPDDTDGIKVHITVMRNQDGDNSIEVFSGNFDLIKGEWMEWFLKDLNFEHDGTDYSFDVVVVDSDENKIFEGSAGHTGEPIEPRIWDENNQGTLYLDMDEAIIDVRIPLGVSGLLYVIVDNEVKIESYVRHHDDGDEDIGGSYTWNFAVLNITEAGDYNITLIFFDGETNRTLASTIIHVHEFENDTFRARYDGSSRYVEIFCPEDGQGNVTVFVYDFDGGLVHNETFKITDDWHNRWNEIYFRDYDFADYDVEIYINDEKIGIEGRGWTSSPDDDDYEMDWLSVMTGEIRPGDDVITLNVNRFRDMQGAVINVSNGNHSILINASDLGVGEWANSNNFYYYVTFEDLESFENFNDMDLLKITFQSKYGKQTQNHVVRKDGDSVYLYFAQYLRMPYLDLISIVAGDEDNDYEFSISDKDASIVEFLIPKSMNATKAEVRISSADNVLYYNVFTNLDDLYEFDEDEGEFTYRHIIKVGDIDFSKLSNGDVVNFTLIFDGKVVSNDVCSYHVDGDAARFIEYLDRISGDVHWGEVGFPEFGQSQYDGSLIVLDIPNFLNVTEGAIEIADDDGNVLYSIQLSEITNVTDKYGVTTYTVLASEFDYDVGMPDGVNLTFSFRYDDTQLVFGKGIRIGDFTHRHVIPEQVAEFFMVTLPDPEQVLVNGTDNVIIITATDSANRQSVPIGIGPGYFAIYVNGKKVEDLGRLIRVDGEVELMAYRLESEFRNLHIYLGDLNITENGVYDVRIEYVVDNADDSGVTGAFTTELFNQNVTLTSNVKTDYRNTTELLTGYGLNPQLLYIDTYYGNIDEVTGRITVFDSNGDEIFSSDIKDLPKDSGRYYLDHTALKEYYGENVTVRYSDGNERNGEVTLDVLWRNATSDDFAPAISEDVNDYYGDIINLTIPDTINDGQIIVTVKFKNKYGADVPGMDVTADFDSKAIFTFNVADIKASYDGAFGLSLSKLGIDDKNGNYTIGIDFTADGGLNTLNIKNQSMEVELSNETVIIIDEFSRYGLSLPFASVKVFKPISAHAVLMIDDEIYATQNFKNGLIEFYSSKEWTAGSHKAEIIVLKDDGTQITNLTQNFETLIKSDDVAVSMESEVRENRNVIVMITVPKSGTATIRINGSSENSFLLREGENTIDLGILSNGEYSVWIAYEATLDDGNLSFYNNFLPLTVGNSWLYVPDPVVVNDDDVIRVSLEKSASGYVVVKINNEVYANVSLINGSCEIKVTGFDYGEYDYNVTYSGDGTYEGLSKAGKLKVTYRFKDDLNTEYPYTDSYKVVISLPDDAKGTVTVTFNGQNYTAEVKNGKAEFEFKDLDIGEHPMEVYYSGDDNYPPMKYSTALNIAYYGSTGVLGERGAVLAVNLLLPSAATGNLIVYFDKTGTWYESKEVTGGKASVDLSKLPIGTYNIRAVYDGNDYDVRPYTATFTVLPKINITQEVLVGDDINISMDLDNAEGYVIIYVGNEYAVREIVDGKIAYSYSTKNIPFGNYSVSFQYVGNSFDRNVFNYWDAVKQQVVPVEYIVNVLPQTFTIPHELEVDNDGNFYIFVPGDSDGILDIYDGERLIGRANLRDNTVQALVGDVKLSISYTEDGRKKITGSFTNKKGTVPLILDFYDDTTYGNFRQNSIANIPQKVKSIYASGLSMFYTANKKYSVTVFGPGGNVVRNVQVNFLINNKAYGSAVTNANGVASIVISKTPGSYKITAKALGVSFTAKLTVKHIVVLKTVKVKKSAKKLVLTATLKKVNGKYLKGKKITFKFNGKTYKAKTNKKGVAKVTIKKRVLKKLKVGKKIKYQATYLKDTVKKTVKVKK